MSGRPRNPLPPAGEARDLRAQRASRSGEGAAAQPAPAEEPGTAPPEPVEGPRPLPDFLKHGDKALGLPRLHGLARMRAMMGMPPEDLPNPFEVLMRKD